MQPPPDDPRPKHLDDPDEWVPLEELLKRFTRDEIEFGIHFSFEGGEEISYVNPEPPADGTSHPQAPDAPSPSAPPPGPEAA